MPQFEGYISGPEVHFDDVIDAVIFRTGVPPVSVFEFEGGKWEGGEVGFDFADGAARWKCQYLASSSRNDELTVVLYYGELRFVYFCADHFRGVDPWWVGVLG